MSASRSPSDLIGQISDLLSEPEAAFAERAARLEGFQAADVISAALQAFGQKAVISTAFGAGGLCVLHMAQQADPTVTAFTIDTGFLFEETHALMARWENERGLRLQRLLPVLTPQAQQEAHGPALWETNPDLCCSIRKVEPNRRALSGAELWITALRRDESGSRSATPILERITLGSGKKIAKLNPIVTWSRKDVWRYIAAHDLPYNPLHDRGYPSVGCTHCTRAVAEGEDERAGRWAGRNKDECGLHLDR